MIRALIIDDEEHGIRSLELLLQKYCPDVNVVASTSDPRQGIKLINDYHPELVFLDIYMPQMNGFDLLEQLSFRKFHLIFATAYKEYALKALKLNAFDYLLKPVDFEELQKAIEKVKLKISKNDQIETLLQVVSEALAEPEIKISLPTKNSIERVHASEIICIEAQSNASIVTLLSNKSLLTQRSLKEYEELLCAKDQGFFRVQNSFIVNLKEVIRYEREDGGAVVMNGGKKIPVSKKIKKEVLNKLGLDAG